MRPIQILSRWGRSPRCPFVRSGLADPIVLDSTPLSLLCQRSTARGVVEIRAWLAARTAAGVVVYLPEIADYEVRRELLRAAKTAGIQRLDVLIADLDYLPLDTPTMRRAAELWGQVLICL
jgi:hypothetical protein